MIDVAVIGAGVTGCAVARELSRLDVSVSVFEMGEDVCTGSSKANSAIAHAGFDAVPGTLMAQLNVEGSRMMEELSKELDFPFKRIGSLAVCTSPEEIGHLDVLYQRGIRNGVESLRIIEREELLEMEPNISDHSCAALYAPGSGIVCPFGMTIAMAENAALNGVDFQLNTEVFRIRQEKESFILETSQGEFRSRSVVNAAGVYADVFHNQVSKEKMSIIPRRGEYLLLDKSAGRHVRHTIFMMPTRLGKGVLVSPTVHGNLLLGPTALNIDDKEGNCTTSEGLSQIREKASETVKDIPFQEVITSFAGLRAYDPKEDFSIGELPDAPGFIDCAGIQSPGLTSAPAIGKRIAGILREKFHLKEKTHFQAERRGILNPKELSMEERNQLIREKPAYGRIICRCEMVSEGEILDAIHRPLGARSLDGLKRRTRAGMGRCQAGFCSPRTMEILSRELPEISMETVSKSGGRSKLILGKNKDIF